MLSLLEDRGEVPELWVERKLDLSFPYSGLEPGDRVIWRAVAVTDGIPFVIEDVLPKDRRGNDQGEDQSETSSR